MCLQDGSKLYFDLVSLDRDWLRDIYGKVASRSMGYLKQNANKHIHEGM